MFSFLYWVHYILCPLHSAKSVSHSILCPCFAELEEYLLATKSQATAAKDRRQSKTGSGVGRGTTRVRALKAPFVKVEDMSRAYKPLVFEVKAWPTPNVHCSPEDSPFDSPLPRKDKAKRQTEKPVRLTPATPKQPVVPLENKPGYCECCKAHFRDVKMVSLFDARLLHITLCCSPSVHQHTCDCADFTSLIPSFVQHLQGEQHLTFATNAKNYAGLDELISQGTSFNDFLSKYTKVKTAESQRLRPKTTAPGDKVAVPLQLEQTPGFVTPVTVSGAKRAPPTSSSSNSRNSPKRLKLVLSPSSLPEGTAGADSGVCLQPDSRCKSPVKENALSNDVGQSPLLRSGRRLKRMLPSSDATDETPIPVSGAKKRTVASSPQTLTPDQCDTPTPRRHSPRFNSKLSNPQSKGPKSPAPQTPQKDKHANLSCFDLAIVVADVSPVHKELTVVLSPTTPCSQASTVSVTPRIDTASSASSWYQPSRRKSLRHLARKLQNSSVSPDADWKQEQKEAFQVSQTLSSSVQSTPTRPTVRSVQSSPQSGLGSVSYVKRSTTETESSSGKRQMPPRRCKKLSPPTVIAATPRNRSRSRRRRR